MRSLDPVKNNSVHTVNGQIMNSMNSMKFVIYQFLLDD